jgi:hypothetical protein
VTLGLTTVPEMVISFSTESVRHGPTRNPRDAERGAGGSSGGPAALAAAGAVPLALGNDGPAPSGFPHPAAGWSASSPAGPDAVRARYRRGVLRPELRVRPDPQRPGHRAPARRDPRTRRRRQVHRAAAAAPVRR